MSDDALTPFISALNTIIKKKSDEASTIKPKRVVKKREQTPEEIAKIPYANKGLMAFINSQKK